MGLLLVIIVLGVGICTLAMAGVLFFAIKLKEPAPSLVAVRLGRFKQKAQQEKTMAIGLSDSETTVLSQLNLILQSSGQESPLMQWLRRFNVLQSLSLLYSQSGESVAPGAFEAFLFKRVLPPLVLGLILSTLFGLSAFLLGLLVAGFPLLMLFLKKQKRFGKLLEQLPESLSLLTSSLRAGHSFQAALGVVAQEGPTPLSDEFKQLVSDTNLGVPLKEVFGKWVKGLSGLTDFYIFSTAILIQRETGGNLAEILMQLGHTIRERFKLKRQIASMTGQAQATGMLLGAAPIAMLGFLSLFFKGYVEPLYSNAWGHVALGYCLVSQIIGFMVIKKILEIDM